MRIPSKGLVTVLLRCFFCHYAADTGTAQYCSLYWSNVPVRYGMLWEAGCSVRVQSVLAICK